MKKALVFIAVLAGVGLAAGLFVFKDKVAVRQLSAAEFLPQETLLFAELPDFRATGIRWRETALSKIAGEPEVQAFLERPRSKIPKNSTWDDVVARLRKADARQVFAAVTAISDNMPRMIAGFSFGGDRKEVEALVAKARAQAQSNSPTGKSELIRHGDLEIETFTVKEITIAGAFASDWYFVANNVELLKSTLDRFGGKAQGALSQAEPYRNATAHMPLNPDARLFIQPATLFDKVVMLSAVSGNPIDPQQAAEMRNIQAVCGGVRLEGERIRDTFFVLQPKGARHPALSGSTLSVTTPDTILYYAFAPLIPDRIPMVDLTALASLSNELRNVAETLGGSTATLTKVKEAFGPEYAFYSDWPAQSGQPTLGLAVQVRDAKLARQFADAVFAGWKQESGADVSTWSAPANAGLPWVPAVALTNKYFLASLNAEALQKSIAQSKAGGATLEKSTTYTGALATVTKPETTLAYLDTKALFERVYDVLRPMAFLGANLIPHAAEYVDFGKLPATQTISKHLQPIILSGAQLKDGVLFESTGPVSVYEAGLGLLAVGGAVAIPMMKGKPLLPGMNASRPNSAAGPQTSLLSPTPAPAQALPEAPSAPPGVTPVPGQ